MLEPLFFKNKRILVIAPHADDEVLGCGGTILKAVEQGANVALMIISVGDLVRVGGGSELRTGAERVVEVERVKEFLGARHSVVLKTDEWSHLRLDSIPRRDLTSLIERESELSILKFKPDLVFLPAPSYNQDHEAVCKAALTACRPHDPSALPVPPGVFLYEYPPNSWCLPQERFLPSLYVDITGYLDRKLEAYALYESQARAGLHQNSPENVRSLALLRGKEASVMAAEAFQTLRIVL